MSVTGQHRTARRLVEAGLGLDSGSLRLDRVTQTWIEAGEVLRDRTTEQLAELDVDVEIVGSSCVLGLLAKPIVDLAVGTRSWLQLVAVRSALASGGWIYRGDAGIDGGHVFVLESAPWHRVGHLHVVEHEGDQWLNYLRLRDLLRRSPRARSRYESVKLELAREFGDDRESYTEGKTDVVRELLRAPS
jgi:GrpB-like predicted nucleotidyltransferase (UPF0157 family)